MRKSVQFLALDLGSTHFKAGLFDETFRLIRAASEDVVLEHRADGPVIDAGWAAGAVERLILAACQGEELDNIAGIGIASMAETGLLVDSISGAPVTPLLPWFSRAAEDHVQRIEDAGESFLWSGIYPSYKSPLAKLLWLRDTQGIPLEGRTWLSASDYAAFLLTGEYATDDSLAGRTLAFDINRRAWNTEWLEYFDLPAGLFPPSGSAGRRVSAVTASAAARCGLLEGTPVTIAGHDHICAALATGVIEPGPALDSMGTAEALLGALPARALVETDRQSGLLYGCHVAPGRLYWMGSLSTSGGAVEWLRSLTGKTPLGYAELEQELAGLPEGPGEILFLPYLNGSGAPHSDPLARAAWIGMRLGHTRVDLFKAVLEGTAYEMEFIRRQAQSAAGARVDRLVAIGGGTRMRPWLQIKADISGYPIETPAMPEATLTGAALLAGVAAGVFSDPDQARQATAAEESLERIEPDAERHKAYLAMYENGYLPLLPAVRDFSHGLARRIDANKE
jgi:sugar (pentulose or hexulose) kinase